MQSTTDALKTASKRAIPKTEEEAGDLTGNKIADKIKRVRFRNKWRRNTYISLEQRQKIINDLRLI